VNRNSPDNVPSCRPGFKKKTEEEKGKRDRSIEVRKNRLSSAIPEEGGGGSNVANPANKREEGGGGKKEVPLSRPKREMDWGGVQKKGKKRGGGHFASPIVVGQPALLQRETEKVHKRKEGGGEKRRVFPVPFWKRKRRGREIFCVSKTGTQEN